MASPIESTGKAQMEPVMMQGPVTESISVIQAMLFLWISPI